MTSPSLSSLPNELVAMIAREVPNPGALAQVDRKCRDAVIAIRSDAWTSILMPADARPEALALRDMATRINTRTPNASSSAKIQELYRELEQSFIPSCGKDRLKELIEAHRHAADGHMIPKLLLEMQRADQLSQDENLCKAWPTLRLPLFASHQFPDLPATDAPASEVREWMEQHQDAFGEIQILVLNNLDLSCIPREIKYMTGLFALSIEENPLICLPAEIRFLTQLQALQVNRNELSSLPKELRELTRLQGIEASDNKLVQLPSMGNLRSLEVLIVNNNLLEELPHDLGSCAALTKLEARNNKLTKLPSGLANLQTLQRAFLGTNKITEIPAEVEGLSSLEELELSKNLIRTLPNEISGLSSLKVFDLDSNLLRKLPKEIGQLTRLTRFRASNNQLTTLPIQMRQLNGLTQIVLNRNQFGEFPFALIEMEALESLNLSHNHISQLTGEEIEHLSSLTQLDLSHNRLEVLTERFTEGVNRIREKPGAEVLLDANPATSLAIATNQLRNTGFGG